MKRFILSIILVVGALAGWAQNEGDKVLGCWVNEQRTSKIEFVREGNCYVSKRVWMAEANDASGKPKTDRNNPDAGKRNQPLIGSTLISGLVYDNGKWTGGKLYLPKRGMYANCSLTIVNGQLHISATKGMFSETKIWSREP